MVMTLLRASAVLVLLSATPGTTRAGEVPKVCDLDWDARSAAMQQLPSRLSEIRDRCWAESAMAAAETDVDVLRARAGCLRAALVDDYRAMTLGDDAAVQLLEAQLNKVMLAQRELLNQLSEAAFCQDCKVERTPGWPWYSETAFLLDTFSTLHMFAAWNAAGGNCD